MTESNVHPRFQERLSNNMGSQRRKLADRRLRCIAVLEYAISSLKELDPSPMGDKVRSLIGTYEWALEELRLTDAAVPLDAQRITAISRLLAQCK